MPFEQPAHEIVCSYDNEDVFLISRGSNHIVQASSRIMNTSDLEFTFQDANGETIAVATSNHNSNQSYSNNSKPEDVLKIQQEFALWHWKSASDSKLATTTKLFDQGEMHV